MTKDLFNVEELQAEGYDIKKRYQNEIGRLQTELDGLKNALTTKDKLINNLEKLEVEKEKMIEVLSKLPRVDFPISNELAENYFALQPIFLTKISSNNSH